MRLWRWPIVLAGLTVAGLLVAMLGDDSGSRWLCWSALALPLAIALRVLLPGSAFRRRR